MLQLPLGDNDAPTQDHSTDPLSNSLFGRESDLLELLELLFKILESEDQNREILGDVDRAFRAAPYARESRE